MGCGTEVRGQWARWDGLSLDLVTLQFFSNTDDSMITCRFFVAVRLQFVLFPALSLYPAMD